MKKVIIVIATLGLMVSLCACGGKTETSGQEAAVSQETENSQTQYDAEAVKALAGSTVSSSSTINCNGCAVVLSYIIPNPKGDEGLDALLAEIEESMSKEGLTPMTTVGEGYDQYFAKPDGEQIVITTIGNEEDGIKYAVEKNASLRYVANVDILSIAGIENWQVMSADEVDYYEEDGSQYPCLAILLGPAE